MTKAHPCPCRHTLHERVLGAVDVLEVHERDPHVELLALLAVLNAVEGLLGHGARRVVLAGRQQVRDELDPQERAVGRAQQQPLKVRRAFRRAVLCVRIKLDTGHTQAAVVNGAFESAVMDVVSRVSQPRKRLYKYNNRHHVARVYAHRRVRSGVYMRTSSKRSSAARVAASVRALAARLALRLLPAYSKKPIRHKYLMMNITRKCTCVKQHAPSSRNHRRAPRRRCHPTRCCCRRGLRCRPPP